MKAWQIQVNAMKKVKQSKSDEKFRKLNERHYGRIYRVSARVLFGEGELAADVVQEV